MYAPQSSRVDNPAPVLSLPRLLDLIGVSPAAITLIAAPAGFGKSTLAALWAERAGVDLAWVSLGPEHNDPHRFLRDMAVAAGLETSATAGDILDRLRARTAPITFVLDDFHRIGNDDVLGILTQLLTSRLPHLRWIILSRVAVRLPLARLRAQGEVREIGLEDLALVREEVAGVGEFLWGEPVPERQVDRLLAFTGGWITGLRLTHGAFPATAAGTARERVAGTMATQWIDTYIAEEVIDHLPMRVQDFVLRTSALPFLEPDIASHVTGVGADEARRMLDMLEQHFIVRREVTETGSTTRYAGWIAASLQRIARDRLPSEIRDSIHERAAVFLLSHDEVALALAEARKSSDLELRTRIVRQLHAPLSLQDRTVLIRELLETLPPPVIRHHPDLAYSYAHALYHRGDTAALTSHLAHVMPAWRDSADPVIRGYALNCNGFVLFRSGDVDNALTSFSEALDAFPETYYRERLHALAGIFESASNLGDDALAEHAVRQAASCLPFLPHHQVTWWMNMHTRFANHHAIRGNLRLAAQIYKDGLKNVPPSFTQHKSFFSYQLAALRFEANELAMAESLIAPAISDVRARPHDDWHADALALGARIAHARGERSLAESLLAEAHATAARAGTRHDLMRLKTIRAGWDIEMGDMFAARAWERSWDPLRPRWITSFGQANATATLMQLRIAEHRFDEAIDIGNRALVEGAARQRHVEMTSIMMWSALAYRGAGREEEATAMLRRALEQRREETVVRAFITPGFDLSLWDRGDLSAAHRAVLDDLLVRTRSDRITVVEPSLTTPRLTDREQEVLALLAESLSNQEISERLFITERTVKKHVSNIMRKMDVPNRTAVVVVAQERGWIDG